jgi:hypothetical protein
MPPLALLCVLSSAPVEKPLPALSSLVDVRIDGSLGDLRNARDLKMPKFEKGSPTLAVKAGVKKTELIMGITINDTQSADAAVFDVTVFFPSAGTTARGFVYRFSSDGTALAHPDFPPPAFAKDLIQAKTKTTKTGVVLEVQWPARSLPRFQAAKQLGVSLCVEYSNGPTKITSCPSGDMPGGLVKLPDDFRKNLRLTPPADVEGLEARAHGWVGYSQLHYPTWAQADEAFTPESLGELIAGEQSLSPAAVNLAIPAELKLHDNRVIFTVLTGANPYVKNGCVEGNELRMAMYVVKSTSATRVLEWPAATCKLGRAMQFELSPEGNLIIGYTNGVTAHFTWTGTQFERSELGLLK